MIKLKILFTFCVCMVAVSETQANFEAALRNFYQKTVNETKFIKRSIDRSESKSNMRRSSEFAKTVHEMFTFIQGYNSKSASRRRRQVVGYTINSTYCPYKNIKITCNSTYKYRSYDGTCNNLVNPLIGAANVPYVRLLSPAYQDGVNVPRSLAVSGRPLPNPRSLSLAISLPSSTQRLSKVGMTQIYAIFGQFLTHDLGGTATTTDQFGNEINCTCASDPSCISFSVPANDSYLGQSCANTGNANVGQANLQCITGGFSTQTCIPVTRSSATFPTLDCQTSYREQLNLLSAYIDGSAIYGMSSVIANQLRAFTGGLLLTSVGLSGATPVPGETLTNRSYLPLSNDTCSTTTTSPLYKCFLAGEYRTSENLGLVSMQTLFNREHNRIATTLAKINPSWNDETLYQETRRIVIAELQHIAYNEFLPQISGNTTLSPLATNAYYTGYDATVDPQLFGEFSTAAFRMGHSLIRQKMGRSNINQSYTAFTNNYFPSYSFYTSLFQSDMAYNKKTEGLNGIFLGMINDIAWKFGTFGFDLQNNLFQTTYLNGSTSSFDLLALNINRGRDHGLQPYVNYIKMCFNVTINSFADLSPNFMNAFNAAQLAELYENVNDIDLYAGGLSEVITGSQQQFTVGPTFGCIIMNQFDTIKRGDRFWYENGPSTSPTAFTLDQLQQIKTVTMSGLICNNYDIFTIPQQAFFYPSTSNTVLSCKSSELSDQLNLNKWALASS